MKKEIKYQQGNTFTAPPDVVEIGDDGAVIYKIMGHKVVRDDFVAFTLFKIELDLQMLSLGGGLPSVREHWTDPMEGNST